MQKKYPPLPPWQRVRGFASFHMDIVMAVKGLVVFMLLATWLAGGIAAGWMVLDIDMPLLEWPLRVISALSAIFVEILISLALYAAFMPHFSVRRWLKYSPRFRAITYWIFKKIYGPEDVPPAFAPPDWLRPR